LPSPEAGKFHNLQLTKEDPVARAQKPLLTSSNGKDSDSFIPTVLLHDPDRIRKQSIEQLIKTTGGRVIEISAPVELPDSQPSSTVALIALSDGKAIDFVALDVIRSLKSQGAHVVSYGDQVFSWPIAIRCRALLSGSALLLDSAAKSFLEELRQTVSKFWENQKGQHWERQQLSERMRQLGIIGSSEQMISVFRWIARVSALSDFPVLINGETGTGKELVANALHQLDNKRKSGPFIAANCGAISSGLAESELFGHRRGAFTGAEAERKGLFRSADGGVLFLDEIGELTQSLQAKLLRVLQEDRVLGVGFDREVPIDVRVIAATNKNLESMVAAGSFREDLYHRLNVLAVTIPPLRERAEDLEPLIEYFLEKYAGLSNGSRRRVSAEFVEAVRQVDLSGNARQLENIVRRALISGSSSETLSLSDLTPAEWDQLARSSNSVKNTEVDRIERTDRQPDFLSILDRHGWNLSRSLEFCERALLECALEFTRGNQSHTARLIGITPRSVYNKLHKHKLNDAQG
jgi:DNA-binding NtrC family response regulator